MPEPTFKNQAQRLGWDAAASGAAMEASENVADADQPDWISGHDMWTQANPKTKPVVTTHSGKTT